VQRDIDVAKKDKVMISNINSSITSSTYSTLQSDAKEIKQNAKVSTSKESGQSRIERLKESINSGEYKVDLTALASKMADELL
jgi:flagellar biosynthesis anti-sigma factor FlgM